MATTQICDACNRAMEKGLIGQGPILSTREAIKIEAAVVATKDGKPAELCLVCLRDILSLASFPEEKKPAFNTKEQS